MGSGSGAHGVDLALEVALRVTADDDGNLKFHVGNSVAGSYVDLRFEMNTLVVLAACQHPLDPATEYQPKEVRLTTWHSRPAPRNDLCRTRCPENERGFDALGGKHRLAPGTTLPTPTAVFPRYVEPEAAQ